MIITNPAWKDIKHGFYNSFPEGFNKYSDDIIFVRQEHTSDVLIYNSDTYSNNMIADAIVTSNNNIVIGIKTADCSPVLFYDKENNIVGISHAGWRGLFSGILENTISVMKSLGAENISAAIGPTISAKHYEVGNDFKNTILQLNPNAKEFLSHKTIDNNEKIYFDLPGYIEKRLHNIVSQIYNCNICTLDNNFHSYRRNKTTERNISIISCR